MKATSLGALALTCSTMSTTGPHTRLWQSSGVPKVSTTGRLPSTSPKLVCRRSSSADQRAEGVGVQHPPVETDERHHRVLALAREPHVGDVDRLRRVRVDRGGAA